MKFTRKDYLNKTVTHAEYYEQFVSPGLKNLIRLRIGFERIKNSKDPHFNDIPLKEWDNLQCSVRSYAESALRIANGPAAGVSLSDYVCVAKAAAKMIRDEKLNYVDFRAQQRKTFNDFPCAFAFSKEQFEEALKKLNVKTDEVYSGEGGIIYKKTDAKKLWAMLSNFDTELETNLKADSFLFDAVSYELANHEYVITYDLDAALSPLNLVPLKLSKQQGQIVLEAVKKYMQTAEA